MTFPEAIEKVMDGKIVQRKFMDFPADEKGGPWSEWTRMYLDDGMNLPDHDRILIIDANNRDNKTGEWYREWQINDLTLADLKANNWEAKE